MCAPPPAFTCSRLGHTQGRQYGNRPWNPRHLLAGDCSGVHLLCPGRWRWARWPGRGDSGRTAAGSGRALHTCPGTLGGQWTKSLRESNVDKNFWIIDTNAQLSSLKIVWIQITQLKTNYDSWSQFQYLYLEDSHSISIILRLRSWWDYTKVLDLAIV